MVSVVSNNHRNARVCYPPSKISRPCWTHALAKRSHSIHSSHIVFTQYSHSIHYSIHTVFTAKNQASRMGLRKSSLGPSNEVL